MDADIFTLPPQPSFQSSGEPIYPKCSELNPCMPSTISIIKDGVCQVCDLILFISSLFLFH